MLPNEQRTTLSTFLRHSIPRGAQGFPSETSLCTCGSMVRERDAAVWMSDAMYFVKMSFECAIFLRLYSFSTAFTVDRTTRTRSFLSNYVSPFATASPSCLSQFPMNSYSPIYPAGKSMRARYARRVLKCLQCLISCSEYALSTPARTSSFTQGVKAGRAVVARLVFQFLLMTLMRSNREDIWRYELVAQEQMERRVVESKGWDSCWLMKSLAVLICWGVAPGEWMAVRAQAMCPALRGGWSIDLLYINAEK